jgi:acetyl esterase
MQRLHEAWPLDARDPGGIIRLMREHSLPDRLRSRAGALVVDNFFRAIATAGRYHPRARPERHQVEVVRNVPYLDDGAPEHLLDIYRPTTPGPWPVMLYVHGGGFRILSKDTHWVMGLGYARRGYLVFNISYRLAPRHPFPAAVADACAAYTWVARHAAAYGGDLSRFALGGESAGANLITSLTIAACYPRPEPFARAVFDTGLVPQAVLPACGIFQVSDVARFSRRRKLPRFIGDRLAEVSDSYLPETAGLPPGAIDLADPLVALERGDPPVRPLPPFFLPVGTRDPLLDDTRRMKAALDRLGVVSEAHYYPGELHAFHALVFRPNARKCWASAYAFLDRHIAR